MTQTTWEKPKSSIGIKVAAPKRLRFMIVGAVLFAAIAFLIISGTANGGRYFITINEMLSRPDLAGNTVKISGAVIGSSIKFDQDTRTIRFTMANITDDTAQLDKEGGLANALHLAVNDPKAARINVIVPNQPIPDLLKDEAQAIITGKTGPDGVFVADELLLKCPSKYSSDVPQQVVQQAQ